MIRVNIPGMGNLELENLVLDFNGTIAVDGRLLPGVEERIKRLADKIKVYVLTADTYGTARKVCAGLNVKFYVLKENMGALEKERFVSRLGAEKTVAVGNGFNDNRMVKKAALGIAVLEGEGAASRTVVSADIIVRDIKEALDLLLNPRGIIATLRR